MMGLVLDDGFAAGVFAFVSVVSTPGPSTLEMPRNMFEQPYQCDCRARAYDAK